MEVLKRTEIPQRLYQFWKNDLSTTGYEQNNSKLKTDNFEGALGAVAAERQTGVYSKTICVIS